jgi:hypothetical protein
MFFVAHAGLHLFEIVQSCPKHAIARMPLRGPATWRVHGEPGDTSCINLQAKKADHTPKDAREKVHSLHQVTTPQNTCHKLGCKCYVLCLIALGQRLRTSELMQAGIATEDAEAPQDPTFALSDRER